METSCSSGYAHVWALVRTLNVSIPFPFEVVGEFGMFLVSDSDHFVLNRSLWSRSKFSNKTCLFLLIMH